jgi:hypothetical protein
MHSSQASAVSPYLSCNNAGDMPLEESKLRLGPSDRRWSSGFRQREPLVRNHELAMLAYARLARLSHAKRHASGRDRFLVLAGYEACQAGWLEVAARCRELVLSTNPQHLLSKADSFPETIRDSSSRTFFTRLETFCPFEQAEHLLRQTNDGPERQTTDTVGDQALNELNHLDGA